jgi:hypothetical protein
MNLQPDDFQVGMNVMITEAEPQYSSSIFGAVAVSNNLVHYIWKILAIDLPFIACQTVLVNQCVPNCKEALDVRSYQFKKVSDEFIAALTEKSCEKSV